MISVQRQELPEKDSAIKKGKNKRKLHKNRLERVVVQIKREQSTSQKV
jgi:hypothetical protein